MHGYGRMPQAFMDDNYDSDNDTTKYGTYAVSRPRHDENMDDDLAQVNDYGETKGENLAAWLKKPEVVLFVRRKFGSFLRTFTDENEQHVYSNRIQEMCQLNKQSIEVNFVHISNKQPTLAIWLAEEPACMLPVLNEVAKDIVAEVYPEYYRVHSQIFVRIRDLPVEDKLRDLRQMHLNALVKFRGVVTKRSGVYPQCYEIYLRCVCGDLKGPCTSSSVQEAKKYAGTCIRCQKVGRYTLDELKTVYNNHQKLTVQETPGTVPPGRVPR